MLSCSVTAILVVVVHALTQRTLKQCSRMLAVPDWNYMLPRLTMLQQIASSETQHAMANEIVRWTSALTGLTEISSVCMHQEDFDTNDPDAQETPFTKRQCAYLW